MSDKNNRIVINLDETDTQDFKTANLIQADAQKSFQELIGRFKNNTTTSNNDKFERVHNTILINGKRGMGKTSFILSMQYNSDIMKELCPLDVIDPTLIETKEHVLLNIITLIKDKVEEFIKNDKSDVSSTKFKDWKESLKKLAGGLSMLDGVGSDHLKDGMWDSPELILEKGLSNAKQGVDLEKNFHKFIDESLTILGKKAFFLILDDIDTSLDKGSAILETLRKYLTSKKLIIAMLGDIDLYSTLVRQLQWEKMDPKKILLKYEFDENKKAYTHQIEHLEEQYLTKVLKPENRIDLKNLLTLKNTLAINTDDNYFEDVMRTMIEKVYLTKDSGYSKYYERTLLTQSTRSVIQVLQAWNEKIGLNSDLIDRFRHTFYTTLNKKLEAYSLVELPEEEKFLNLLAVYILKENFSKENHLKLMPNFAKDDDNITMLYLNMMANSLLKPQDYLSYFIKVGYAYEGYEDVESEKGKEDFIDNIMVENREPLYISSEKILSTLTLKSLNNASNGYRYFGNMFIKEINLDSLENKEKINFLIQTITQKQKSFNFLSFFSLLSHLADVQNYSNDLVEWSKKANKIVKIPLYVLSKIWVRFAKTIYVIEERSENSNKNYGEIFALYVAGFLNAVYIEIELYENREYNRKNNSTLNQDNVSSSSEYFNSKLKTDIRYDYDEVAKNYILKNSVSDYTLFDYIYECPLFNSKQAYINILSQISMEDKQKKKDVVQFSKLTDAEIKEILKTMDNWENRATTTVANDFRYRLDIKYMNVSNKRIKQLQNEANK